MMQNTPKNYNIPSKSNIGKQSKKTQSSAQTNNTQMSISPKTSQTSISRLGSTYLTQTSETQMAKLGEFEKNWKAPRPPFPNHKLGIKIKDSRSRFMGIVAFAYCFWGL